MGEHMMARRAGFKNPDDLYEHLETKHMPDNPKNGKIETLLPVIAAEIGPIAKARKNEQQGYAFRGIEDILNAAHGVFMKYGVVVMPHVVSVVRETHQSKNGNQLFFTLLTVDYTFTASDGSARVATTVGEGMDSGDKSANKAMTAAFKNALIQVLMIPFAADEPEEDSHETVAAEKQAPQQQSKPPEKRQQQPPPTDAQATLNAASIRVVPYYWDAEAKQMMKMQAGSLNDEQLYEALDKARWTKTNKSGKYAKDAAADEMAITLVMKARNLEVPEAG